MNQRLTIWNEGDLYVCIKALDGWTSGHVCGRQLCTRGTALRLENSRRLRWGRTLVEEQKGWPLQ